MKRPMNDKYRCLIHYTTGAGHERKTTYVFESPAADLALDRAERLLKADKRRDVAAVTYGEAETLRRRV